MYGLIHDSTHESLLIASCVQLTDLVYISVKLFTQWLKANEDNFPIHIVQYILVRSYLFVVVCINIHESDSLGVHVHVSTHDTVE